jgi:large subunit ribosomal protein L23
MKSMYDVLQGPCLTEKSNILQELHGIVVLNVNPKANKFQIRNAVEELFDVKVKSVKTVKTKGKGKRVGMKSIGTTSDRKKAYVTLSEGEINFLDEL